jgi:hypothetical protein
MKTIGLTITEFLTSEQQSEGYSPNETTFEELLVFPEYAIYLMLGIRIILLILGDPRKWGVFAFQSDSCSWDGARRVCTCS